MNCYTIRWVEGTPVLSIDIEGHHDIGRIINTLGKGRVEDHEMAQRIATELRHGHGQRGLAILTYAERAGVRRMGVICCAHCDGELGWDSDASDGGWWFHTVTDETNAPCDEPYPSADELEGLERYVAQPWFISRGAAR